ncbi:MAG TPA: hypothetical protein DDZ05_01705 [Candidatus Blackburnbacteria bacterium]|uniref:Regulatory protein RecX n=1 Tax=Candidatus Blackburnbacteria bacterium RIFCSPLOWO2_01_FULL_40_20 TaxID=1797519 RepID=A0A1G1VD19_9BACT|nr:MAG: hypothetical protein A3A77_02705 [Candidatus Blackburnbacteria bacterium RIFCSPLOWO2_01_FULL_40_20]HBL51925.1 hypothetical protein [Candidatus Blackburnbacteria bacterium]
MSTITHIKQQKDKSRANVYLDGKFAFGVTLEELLKHGLKVGKELASLQIEKIKGTDHKERVYGNAVKFAMMRPRSEKEIRQWFKRTLLRSRQNVGASEGQGNIEDDVFNRLKNLELVDDLKFAQWWVEQRLTFRQKSKRVIGLELKSKGVSDDIIKEVLLQIDTDQEVELAKKIVEKKLRVLGSFPEDKRREKLIGALARRGFSWETIKKVVDVD